MAEQIIDSEYTDYDNDMPVTKKAVNVAGGSPCIGCPQEHKSKDQCVEECLRLKAFQFNKSYQHLPYYVKTSKSVQIADKEAETPKPVKPVSQETSSWKKVFPKKKKANQYEQLKKLISEGGQCLLCKNQSERMGLCMVCWQRWYHARVKHPVIGSYRIMTREEIILARHGNPVECLIEGCKRIGNKSGLCNKHYKQWHDGRIEKPGVGKWFPKKKKRVAMKDKVEYKINLTTEDEITPAMMDRAANDTLDGMKQERVISHSVLLDFAGYPELYRIIKEISKIQYLPINHVILNQIATGVMFGENKAAEEKVRNVIQRKELSDGVQNAE